MTLCFASASPLLRSVRLYKSRLTPLRPAVVSRPSARPSTVRFATTMAKLTSLPATRTDLGPRVVVVGGNRGLGLAMVDEVAKKADRQVVATCRDKSHGVAMENCGGNVTSVAGIDVGDNDCGEKLVQAIKSLGWSDVSTVMIVAGVFTQDTLDTLNADLFDKCINMYNVCAVGPLRIVSSLTNSGLLKAGSRIGMITSEGGSMGLRTDKEGGDNYGHHAIMALDLKPKGIALVNLHPGFMRTEMTAHYADSYDELGAVTPDVSAPLLLEAVERLTLEDSGKFISPMGSENLGYGIYALEGPLGPFSELPW